MIVYLGRCFKDTLCDFCFASDTDGMILSDFVDELVFTQRFCMVIDLKALLLEGIDGLHADVFEQEKPDIVLVDGSEDLGLPDGICDGLCTDAFSEGGVSG